MVRLADGTKELRLYAGHHTWAPGQLQAEIGAGGWQVLLGTAELVFDEDPGGLWRKLEGRGADRNNVVAADRQERRRRYEARAMPARGIFARSAFR
jgi:putative AlgH/UPF0301 family transcriptional regulator